MLAFLLLAVAIPILVAASFYAIFASGNPGAMIGSIVMTLLTVAALVFCIWMASVRSRANAYLKKFPDLIGPVKGAFRPTGLLVNDGEKTHWFPWVQLFRLAVTKIGVRVPVDQDPRRFLALAPELFSSYHPEDLKAMRAKYSMRKSNYDELIAESAGAFEFDVQAGCFFSGTFQKPATTETWIRVLIGPVSLCGYVGYLSLLGRWNWISICLCIVLALTVFPSVWKIGQLFRNQLHSMEVSWGWLTETDLISGAGLHVMKIPLASLKTIGRSDGILEFQLASGRSLYLYRILFRDPSHFDLIDQKLREPQSLKIR